MPAAGAALRSYNGGKPGQPRRPPADGLGDPPATEVLRRWQDDAVTGPPVRNTSPEAPPSDADAAAGGGGVARSSGGFWQYQDQARNFYNDIKIQVFVAGLIGMNFVCSIIEKQVDPRGNDEYGVFGGIELFFNIAFTIELAVNMYGHWFKAFWKSGWNVFDFIVVSVCLMFTFNVPLPGPLGLLKMLRAFRVFRLFKRVKSLNKIMVSLAKAVPGVMNAFLIVLIVMCIYAILGVEFWLTYGQDFVYVNMLGENVELKTARGQTFGQEYFGNFIKSWYTMFQVLTGESWSEAVARPLLFGDSTFKTMITGIYFISFILVVAVVLINVVVAVLLEKMVDNDDPDEGNEDNGEDNDEQVEDETKPSLAMQANVGAIREDMRDLQSQIDKILAVLEFMEKEDPAMAFAGGSRGFEDPAQAFFEGTPAAPSSQLHFDSGGESSQPSFGDGESQRVRRVRRASGSTSTPGPPSPDVHIPGSMSLSSNPDVPERSPSPPPALAPPTPPSVLAPEAGAPHGVREPSPPSHLPPSMPGETVGDSRRAEEPRTPQPPELAAS